MGIVRVGFIELWVRDLEASLGFYRGLLGFRLERQEGRSAYLRGYEELEWSLKLTQAPFPAVRTLGFKVDGEEALEALLRWAEEEGLPHREEADWGRPRILRVQDPFGYPLAFYHRAEKLERVLQRYHEHRGPGILRLDHFNVFSPEVGEATRYYRERLGFRLTEYTEDEEGRLWASWLHRKGNVHDIAFTNGEGPRLHHFAYWLPDPMAILRAADILAGAVQTDRIERGPGRHGISNAMFLYLKDPDGHRIELYTSDYLTVDPDHPPLRWSLNDPRRQTLWGHRTPKSWFLEGSPLLSLEDAPLPTRPSPLQGLPEHVI
ncbi:3,4-dihydroxyphenylacetate 2,3-dioxygenase [Thermus filiformis]|uniref:3,4-dihydroxyphenylacetate 2,3-dioxygenase n=1 Tax=Thermus filiformis TaxID=276 RepID=A0A0D6X9Z0_THEFI|nr:3,4-dihydroxyphenylacetate 2,3-dioxygenase [Thermus filiformis]KIX84560.1 3,4-dihydroxyphenylacetate 2,3-dioxygenase [Thermus filiformis]